MLIGQIAIRMAADTTRFREETLRSAAALDAITASAERARSAVSGVDLGQLTGASVPGASAGTAAPAPAPAEEAADFGGQLRSSLMRGIEPLKEIGGHIEQMLNRVGGTIVTLARRIDAAMKFPALDAALANLEARFKGTFTGGAIAASRMVLRVRDFLGSLGDVAGKTLDRVVHLDFSRAATSASTLEKTFLRIPAPIHAASSAVKGLGVQIGIALGIVGIVYKTVSAVIGLFKTGIKGASDLGETTSKVAYVFGDATGKVTAQAEEMSQSFGLPKGAMLDAAASIGLIGKGAGQSAAEAANMADDLAQLAADASSFYNVPLDESLGKIRSGLVGESEPLRAFGVLLSEDAVKAQAAAMGLDAKNGKLSEAAKVTARYALIQRGLATATGDLERTQGSVANQWRKLTGMIGNAATAVGISLMPAIQSAVDILTKVATGVSGFFERNSSRITTLAGYAAAGFRNMAEAISELPRTLAVFAGDFRTVVGDLPERIFPRLVSLIRTAVTQVGVVLRNLPEYMAIARLKLGEQIATIPEYFRYVKAVAAETGMWIADRFRYAGAVIAAEIAYWIDHIRYFKDITVAIVSGTAKLIVGAFVGITGAIGGTLGSLIEFVTGTARTMVDPFVISFRFLSQIAAAELGAVVKVFSAGISTFAVIAKAMVAPFVINFRFLAGIAATEFGFIGKIIGKVFSAIGSLVGRILGKLGAALRAIPGEISAALAKMTADVKAIQARAVVAAPKAFELPPPPDLTSYQSKIDEILKQIQTSEAALKTTEASTAATSATKAFGIPGTGTNEAEKKGRTGAGTVAAAELGSKEAYSSITAFLNGRNDATAKTASNTTRMVTLLAESNSLLSRSTGMGIAQGAANPLGTGMGIAQGVANQLASVLGGKSGHTGPRNEAAPAHPAGNNLLPAWSTGQGIAEAAVNQLGLNQIPGTLRDLRLASDRTQAMAARERRAGSGKGDNATAETARNTKETAQGLNKLQQALLDIARRGGSGHLKSYTFG